MSYPYCHYSFEYFLEAMGKFQIENIEIWGGSPHLYYEDATEEKLNKIKKNIKEQNMKISAYTPEQVVYPYNIAAQEPEIRRRSIKYFKENIEIAANLESPLLLINGGWGYLNESKDEAWKRSKESLCLIAEHALKYNIKLALEPLTKISSNLINYAKELAQMIVEVNSPMLFGMLDVGQMAILNETVEDYFEALGQSPIYIHIMDGSPEGHLAFGDGILRVDKYIKRAIELGYQGYFSMEINDRRYYLDPDNAIKKSIEKLKEWVDTGAI